MTNTINQPLQSQKRFNHFYNHQIFYNTPSIMSALKKSRNELLFRLMTLSYFLSHKRTKTIGGVMTTEKKPEIKRLTGSGKFSHVGNQLIQLRLLLNLEQYELAMQMKISLNTVIGLEKGTSQFKLKTEQVMPLINKYGVDSTWLFTGAGNIFQRKTQYVPFQTYLAAMLMKLNGASSDYPEEYLRFLELPSQLDRIEANQREILQRLGAPQQIAHLKEAV